MPHTPHGHEDPKREQSALIAEAIRKASEKYPDQEIAQHILQLLSENLPRELPHDVTSPEDHHDDAAVTEHRLYAPHAWIEQLLPTQGITDDHAPDDERIQRDAARGNAATPEGKSTSPVSPLPRHTYLSVIGASCYQGTREAVAQGAFEQADGSPWPTALLKKGTARGHIQLRPVIVDNEPFMPPEEIDKWTQIMWRQRDELSDLDADTLDALSALWLHQTHGPNDNAVANVDDLLAMRGLSRKRGGSGRRGGYMPHQRTAMLQSLSRVQNLWLTMAELETYDDDTHLGTRRRKPTKRAILSRAFVMKDLMGQVRLDGFIDVEQFIFQPGTVFAHFLSGPGRQTALLSAKALQYHPSGQTWEKRLTRYLSWQWRCEAHYGNYLQPLRIKTLLEAAGQRVNRRRFARQREHMEKTLDTIREDDIIAAWQYAMEADYWPDSTVLIEPPDRIREQYQHLERHEARKHRAPLAPEALGERLKRRRQALKLSQLQAAEHVGLNQGYYSRLERGKTTPSPAVRTRLDTWCVDET